MNLNSLFNNSLLTHPDIIIASTISTVITFIPKLLLAFLIFLAGKVIANHAAGGLVKIIQALQLKKVINSLKLGINLSETAEATFLHAAGLAARYVVLYVTLILSFDVLGFRVVSELLRSMAQLVPPFLSAGFIILIGLIIAGLVESLVKKTLITVDPAAARLGGKVASYTVISLFILISLSEIGVASTFINSLLTGFIASLALAFGLAVGLGSKDVVKQVIETWYHSRKSDKQTRHSKTNR